MKTHFCKVGTVRSNLDSVKESIQSENNSIELKTKKTKPNSKSE